MKQAKASYAFNARSDAEISFDAGDVIVILEEDPSGWGKGRTKDYKEGYFPLAYVQVEDLESDSDEEPQLLCTAMYDFVALSELQLSFTKGDVINITKKGNDNDWWEGTLQYTQQKGLFPSNYVKLEDQHNIQITKASDQRIFQHPQPNNFEEHTQTQSEKREEEAQYKISEPIGSEDHKKDEGSRSNFRIEDSFATESAISSVTVRHASQYPSISQNTSLHFPNNLSAFDASVPFELHTENYHREFATLSPISPNLSTLAYDPAEIARRRHSMNLSAAPLSLSAFSGEYTRDFDALCLLYPFVPSSVSQSTPPPLQSLFTPAKISTTNQLVAISPSTTDTAPQPISKPIFIPPSHQISQPRPQSAPQFFTPSVTPSQSSSTQTLQSPPKPVVPKLPLTSSSPDRKERYSNRDQRERNSSGTSTQTSHAGTPTNAPTSADGGAKTPGRTPNKYGAIKSPGARRDANVLSGSVSKRKVKLEGSFSMGKKPNSTITHSNSTPEQAHDSNASVGTQQKETQQALPQQNEVEYLKKLLQQEVELRTHLESVVHDAHGKMHSASQYIKDLKAELFQAHMDISQLRVTNRQLNEQLDKYQLVTRVTVTTQTERDENIDKIRVLTEQIHELEANTDLLNEQIVILKNRPVERSPRNVDRSPRSVDRSPRGNRSVNEGDSEGLMNRSDARVDYAAVKQQFARVRECLLLEKEIKDRLIVEKTQAQEKLQKTEQHSKQIKRKLLTELQLKSDLNVRNQQIEMQMIKLKEELAVYKHLSGPS